MYASRYLLHALRGTQVARIGTIVHPEAAALGALTLAKSPSMAVFTTAARRSVAIGVTKAGNKSRAKDRNVDKKQQGHYVSPNNPAHTTEPVHTSSSVAGAISGQTTNEIDVNELVKQLERVAHQDPHTPLHIAFRQANDQSLLGNLGGPPRMTTVHQAFSSIQAVLAKTTNPTVFPAWLEDRFILTFLEHPDQHRINLEILTSASPSFNNAVDPRPAVQSRGHTGERGQDDSVLGALHAISEPVPTTGGLKMHEVSPMDHHPGVLDAHREHGAGVGDATIVGMRAPEESPVATSPADQPSDQEQMTSDEEERKCWSGGAWDAADQEITGALHKDSNVVG